LYIIQLLHTFQVNFLYWSNVTQNFGFLERSLEYIDRGTCRNIDPDKFDLYVTYDKFCTDNKLGNTNLDSGCSHKRIN